MEGFDLTANETEDDEIDLSKSEIMNEIYSINSEDK